MNIHQQTNASSSAPELDAADPIQQANAVNGIVGVLSRFDAPTRARLLRAAATILNIADSGDGGPIPSPIQRIRPAPTSFSQPTSSTSKSFLLEKEPRTDIERVACLGFYLTHFRETPEFDTADISALNVEAAQPKFSNASWAVGNALKQGFLAQASRGKKQLSAIGEQFVHALPDREAAKAAIEKARGRRRARKNRSKTESGTDSDSVETDPHAGADDKP